MLRRSDPIYFDYLHGCAEGDGRRPDSRCYLAMLAALFAEYRTCDVPGVKFFDSQKKICSPAKNASSRQIAGVKSSIAHPVFLPPQTTYN